MEESLDELSSGGQQDGIGVWPGPEDPITIVEMIVERLRELVGAAVFVILVSLHHQHRGSPVLFTCRVSLPEVAQVWLSGSDAVVLLGLQGNQGRGQT